MRSIKGNLMLAAFPFPAFRSPQFMVFKVREALQILVLACCQLYTRAYCYLGSAVSLTCSRAASKEG